MNKEFRAYDKETCQMFYPMKDSCLLSVDYCELKFLVADISSGSVEEDDYIVMQWTGLYDRNGVKIFEGDIVLCRGGAVRSIFFRERYADYGAAPNGVLDDACSAWVICENGEIIGNIYESPELLKEAE